MNKIMPQLFGAALVTAFVVAYFTFLYHHYFDVSWIQAGLATSLVMWLGGAATTVFIHNTTDMRPIKLTAITLGNRLLSLMAMGAIIGWLHP
jgi:hypothetical protein